MSKQPRAKPIPDSFRSACPVACSLDLLGDRWTLLIVRDLFRGKTRYGEFLASPEGIPTNILADRLVRLEQADLISSAAYQQKPPRYAYTLTGKGTDLKPVLAALAGWALRHVSHVEPDEQLLTLFRNSSRDLKMRKSAKLSGHTPMTRTALV